ncbi:HD domain-containing protein [Candidatus Bandiella euplotis]|uniref:HD domain-containing protein n=1 Tax=Candidatus Bandiella euplotis TaxID=1664265 RepID=UPI002B2592DF|nr:HD domain-containing protein [Candidatus Bandiella woodruffii]
MGFTIASFGLAPLTDYFGYYALWVLYCPVIIGFLYGLNHVKKLEIKKGRYYNYPNEDGIPDTALMGEMESDDFVEDKEAYMAYSAECKHQQKLMNIILNKAKQENKELNIPMIRKAIKFAKKWHAGQNPRDNGEPFYSHPFAVAEIMTEFYLKTDVIIAAILHDVVEDSDCTVELIEKEFNPRVAQIVCRLTNKKQVENGKTIEKLSLKEVVDKLHETGDHEALLIKEIDRLHNLETIGARSEGKQVNEAQNTQEYLIPIVAHVGDELSISHAFKLENKLFKYCRDILRKRK